MAFLGLKLLQSYGSGSSDESSSEEDVKNKDIFNKSSPKKSTLPLPVSLKEMFTGSKINQPEDEPEFHDGKVRSFPHSRGNWVSFVGISLNEDESVQKQKQLFKICCAEYPDYGFQFCSDFHVSLTKTQVFRHHWIDSFISTISSELARLERFQLVFDQFEVYVNDEKTRTFVGMKVYPSYHFQKLINVCDKALADYDLEPYYEDPSFHVSVGWILGDKKSSLAKTILPSLNREWNLAVEDDPALQLTSVKSIQFKTGNKLYEFPLANS